MFDIRLVKHISTEPGDRQLGRAPTTSSWYPDRPPASTPVILMNLTELIQRISEVHFPSAKCRFMEVHTPIAKCRIMEVHNPIAKYRSSKRGASVRESVTRKVATAILAGNIEA